MAEQVVVTGIGLLSPAGNTVGQFWESMVQRLRHDQEITSFDTSPFRHKRGYQVPEFSLQDYVKETHINRMERFPKMVLAAGTIALQDSGLAVSEENALRVGSMLTTVYGPVNVTVKYLRDLIERGPSQVSPIYFQQTVMNVGSGQLSIQYQLKGVSSTLVGCSSTAYAVDLIRSGRADAILVIGVEEQAQQVFHAYSGTRLLAEAAGEPGIMLGEGCAAIMLESAAHARRRGARVYGELIEYVTLTDRLMNRHVAVLEGGPESAIHQAVGDLLAMTGVGPADIALVSGLANGAPAVDEAEAEALSALTSEGVPVLTVKEQVGESQGASELFSLIGALLCLHHGQVPGPNGLQPAAGPYALCTSMFPGGNVNAFLIRKAGE